MAAIIINFYHCPILSIRRQVTWNTITKVLTSNLPFIVPGVSCKNDADILYTDATDDVRVMSISPYAFVSRRTLGSVNNPSAVVAGTTVTLTTPYAGTKQYRLISFDSDTLTAYDSGWQTSNIFTGLSGATYMALVQDPTLNLGWGYRVNILVYDNLVASTIHSDVSAAGASDGSITGLITAGSGSYTIGIGGDVRAVAGTPGSEIFSGLAEGDYIVDFVDMVTLQELHLPVSITVPSFEIPASDFFFVPKIQSYEFVHEIDPDDCSTFMTLDNVRLCKQNFPYFLCTNYYQKIARCDVRSVQWQSNYASHEVTLRKYTDDSLVATFAFEKVVRNVGKETDLVISIKDNGAGTCRIYFATALFPIPVDIGMAFIIADNAEGMNGSFSVLNTGLDAGVQYFVITLAYLGSGPTSGATGKFFSNVLNFDIFESVIDLTAQADGDYYLKIRAFTDTNEAVPGLSEPIKLADKWPNTNVIDFSNFDSAFDIDYTTGIKHRIRVESRLFKRNPTGVMDVTRNTTGELIKLRAKKQRQLLFEFFQLPPYLHEKLSVIFGMDSIKINGVEFQTDQDISNPAYITRFKLANSSITVEQVTWFKTYNSNDLRPVDLPPIDEDTVIGTDGGNILGITADIMLGP